MPSVENCQLCFPSLSLVNTEEKISFATKNPSRHIALKLSGLASSWADSICLSFSEGHMELWAGSKVYGFGPHWSENSVSDCWQALKYLVLITATTFTLVGYCWNIIPMGAARLSCHRGDGSYYFTPALFFFLTKNVACPQLIIWPPSEQTQQKIVRWGKTSIALNYAAAKLGWRERLISLLRLEGFWTSHLFFFHPVHLAA